LGLGFGYPALVAISKGKMMYSVMKLSFTEKNVRKFVLGLMTGKEKVKKL